MPGERCLIDECPILVLMPEKTINLYPRILPSVSAAPANARLHFSIHENSP
jgi:hypothetical protein